MSKAGTFDLPSFSVALTTSIAAMNSALFPLKVHEFMFTIAPLVIKSPAPCKAVLSENVEVEIVAVPGDIILIQVPKETDS